MALVQIVLPCKKQLKNALCGASLANSREDGWFSRVFVRSSIVN